MNRLFSLLITKVLVLACAFSLAGQEASQPAPAAIYRDLLNPVLLPGDVHQLRGVNLDREDLHIALSDGIIGFIQAVDGHVTGAVFEGTGEILVVPPNRAERTSLALFTGSAVLEQQFVSAYFRFFDDRLLKELQAGVRPIDPEEIKDFLERWQQPAKLLARIDGLPVLQAMENAPDPAARYFHARLGGT